MSDDPAGETGSDDVPGSDVPGDGAGEISGEAEELVSRHMLMALAVGLIPVPVVDIAALIAIQLRMLGRLAVLYDVEFSEQVGRSLIGSLLGAGGSFLATKTTTRFLFRFVPVGGWLAGAVSASVFAGASTYAVGKVFIQHFESGGTFVTFDPEMVRDYYAQQFERGSAEVAKGFPAANT